MESDEEAKEYLSWFTEAELENMFSSEPIDDALFLELKALEEDSIKDLEKYLSALENDESFLEYANQNQCDRMIDMEAFIKDHINDAYVELDEDFEKWYTDMAMESKNNLEAIPLDEIFIQCPYPSEAFVDVPIGMFHCPMCGEMVLAGIPHPKKIIAISQKEYNEFMKALDKDKERW